jgi:sensor histidine kinase YesM
MSRETLWKNDVKVLLTHFLLGGGAISLAFSYGSLLSGDIGQFIESWLINGTLWVLIGLGSGWMVRWLDRRLPWLEAPVKRLIASLLMMIVYSVGVAFLVLSIYAVTVYGIGPLQAVQNAGFTFPLAVVIITLIVGLFLHGRGFFLDWKHAFKEAEEHKRAALSAKYEALKNQVNPHFLFNSFNVLSNLVYKDPDLSAKFIQQLSKVYRYVLETRQQELVSLEEELEMLKAYLFLLEIRFGQSLQVEQAVQADTEDAVVPLTLQMLAENAIKHNIVSKSKPLKLQITRSNGHLLIQNTLQPKQNEQESLGVGLPNIQERYRYLCGKGLEIEQSNGTFTVKVPIVQLKDA